MFYMLTDIETIKEATGANQVTVSADDMNRVSISLTAYDRAGDAGRSRTLAQQTVFFDRAALDQMCRDPEVFSKTTFATFIDTLAAARRLDTLRLAFLAEVTDYVNPTVKG